MADIAVGTSEYQNLRGRTQWAEMRAGLQLLALLAFIAPMLGGYRITINEARRSRPDQLKFWNAYQVFRRYGRPWAAVAAVPYTSKHDSGLAFDLAGPGGSVISDAAHALLVKYGPRFGIHWIGRNFGEKWHFEYVPGTASVLASNISPVPIKTPQEERDMADYSLIKGAHDPKVYLSVNRMHRRWIRSEADLADVRYLLRGVGAPAADRAVEVVGNPDAYGIIVKTNDELIADIDWRIGASRQAELEATKTIVTDALSAAVDTLTATINAKEEGSK